MTATPINSAPELPMSALIASIDRAGDHAVVVGMLAMIALVGGLVYRLFQLMKRRAGRSRSDQALHRDRGQKA